MLREEEGREEMGRVRREHTFLFLCLWLYIIVCIWLPKQLATGGEGEETRGRGWREGRRA